MQSVSGAELEGQSFAAVDLGSNSFHLVVARYSGGQLQLVDRLREVVRMAAGLDADGSLNPAVRDRALATLARFGQRLRGFPDDRVRAVATNSVRQMRVPRSFLLPAETALGFPIEVVAGREEARLIYLGVAHAQPASRHRRLVIDIGGGSTEFIIGQGFEALETESTQMGCVATTERFFPDGRVTRKRWREAEERLSLEFLPFREAYLARGWRSVIGSSGTIKAIARILHELGGKPGEIAAGPLAALVEKVVAIGDIERVRLPGLSEDRRAVFAGGLAILDACFRELKLSRMQISEAALREGILHDMLGRLSHRDPREASVRALGQRFSVDAAQAERVRRTALVLFDQVAAAWGLGDEHRDTLAYAAALHEVGLAISHSQQHVHGAYVVAHSDLPGFTQQEQSLIATLVRCHRRRIAPEALTQVVERELTVTRRLAAILRLAVVLHRTRSSEALPPLVFQAEGATIKLRFPTGWLAAHPLTRADLREERQHLLELGIKLRVVSAVGERETEAGA
jgi:exopolyphosphatase/guanosine-5'-triphosphate,3'-diphosphate pyrophosphatase